MWLIDGSNLGGVTGGARGARDHAGVVRRIQAWVRGRRERVVLVFDGEPDPGVADHYGALEVVWSGAGRTADDRIVAMVSKAGATARGIVVVSDDADLRGRVAALGARVERAAGLLARVESKRARAASSGPTEEKPLPTRAENEEWAGLFTAGETRRSGGGTDSGGRRARRRSRSLRSLALALVAVAAASCDERPYLPITGSVSAAEMAKRPPIDACLLVLRSDVDPDGELELTKASNLLDEQEGPFFAKCAYGKRRPWRFVSLEVRRSLDEQAAQRIQRASRPFLRRLAREPLVDVPGIGDAAVWAGGELDQLHVLSGDLRLIFSIEIGEDPDRKPMAERLGALALDRLSALGWDRLIDAPAAAAAPAAEGTT